MYSSVLLPIDGSAGMASAIRHAFHQAEIHDATLHTLYVVNVRAYLVLPDETQERVHELLVEEGEAAVAFVEELAAERDIETRAVVQEGIPAEMIVDYATEGEIDLVVMGTEGQTGEQMRVVGSVAEEVVRNAPVPALTVRSDEADAEAFGDRLPIERARYIQ